MVRLSLQSKVHIYTIRAHVPETGANALRIQLEPQPGMSLTFQSFLLAGAVPPYSAFLLDVLRYYGIRLAHLTPNSMVILSVFAYLCEQFLGVPPSLDLFRSYCICRGNAKPLTIGSCHFRLRRKQNTPKFIYVHRHVPQQWKDRWVYIEDHIGHEETAVPSQPAVSTDRWQTMPPVTPQLAALHKRVAELRRHGLTGAMVLADAVKRRLSPLRSRERLAYLYAGEDDDMRTFSKEAGCLSPIQISVWMQEILGTSGLDTLPPAEARPLCELEPLVRIQRMATAVPVETEQPPAVPVETEQPPAATSGGTTKLRRRKRRIPTKVETEDSRLASPPSARRRCTRHRSDGEGGGGPRTMVAIPLLEHQLAASTAITVLSREKAEMKRELEKVKRDLQKAIAEKHQCRDTCDRARAALRQLDMDHDELQPQQADDSDSCALFGRVVDSLELIVRTMPDHWLEGAREVAIGTTELVLGHCLRLHPQVDLEAVIEAAVEEELPPPETDEAQALHNRVLEGARQIVHQRVQVQPPIGDGEEEDTSVEE